VIPAVDCDFLQARRRMQMEYINRIENMLAQGIMTSFLPMFPYEIKGIEALKQVAKALFDNSQAPVLSESGGA
jgi:anion-transporting  ArsA/GET3 family ATPase